MHILPIFELIFSSSWKEKVTRRAENPSARLGFITKGQIKSEWIYEGIDFPDYTVWILLHNKKNQRNCCNLTFTSYNLKIGLILYILV